MKERLTHNLGLKILSVVLAAFTWFLIMNVADPVVTQTFNNIPVQIEHDDVLTNRGYQYTVESGDKVDIKVKGKSSIVNTLTENDFKATADFNSLTALFMASITVECTSEHASEVVISIRNETMAVKLEDQEIKSFNVRIVQNGELKPGYYCYDTSCSPQLITATASVTTMQSVKELVAVVDVSDANATFTADCELVAYDFQGNEIDSQKVSLSQSTVPVTVGIYPTKTVDIKITTTEEPAAGYYVEKIEYAPQNIVIAADENALKNISEIEIPCSVAGANSNIEVRLDAEDYLHEHYGVDCFIADASSYISAVVTVSPMVEKVLELSENSILPMNLAEGLECVIYSVGSSVTVKGPAAEIERLTVEDLRLYIDLAGCISGTYSRQVKARTDLQIEIKVSDVMVRISEQGTDQNQD
ncbi:MAG: hypothetical protein J5728_06080 [Lachnospiraceae bacterium]|nr:hypothetical protein [Lachnospiraceae bacterium]